MHIHLSGDGLQWSTINSPVGDNGNFTMLHTFLFLTLDIALYSLITWYLYALLPGDFGTPQPFYFPFTVSTGTSFLAVGVSRG
jgi:ATP-binding cassette, subfamily A (ABC1), member 3